MKGDKIAAANADGVQNSLKIKNNSLSGAHVSQGTILYNKSSHSTLTSTCRAAASYGNANNEKFLMGNRHYWCPDAVIANIVSVINHANLKQLEAVMQRYNLHYPSTDEAMKVIQYSTELYWRSDSSLLSIRQLVHGLSSLERAAFIYVGDFYHLAKFNPDFVRGFLKELSSKATVPAENPDPIVASMDGDLRAFVSMLCAHELQGQTIEDASEREDKTAYGIIAATIKNIEDTVTRYRDMIQVLWVSDTMPSDVALIPTIIRRSAITSDTDSTIFSVQFWTNWYVGKIDFSEESKAIMATMIYLASETIRHILAQLSANMGVARQHLSELQMKNEFAFPVFVPTSRAKHYFAYVSAQEGNVFKKMDVEIKGVALRSSAVPNIIMKKAKDLMLGIMDDVMAGKKISYREKLEYVASVERDIIRSIENRQFNYFSTSSIKTQDSYKTPYSSNFLHYEMWEEVFANKYGHTEPPPYVVVKVPLDAGSPAKLKKWLKDMKDPAIADAMRAWLEKRQRKDVTMLLLPLTVLTVSGIPEEIVKGIDTRGLVSGLCESFYLILESLGLYYKNKQLTRLASDAYG